jgi:hypothetical protein
VDISEKEFQERWAELVKQLEEQFGEGLDIDGILFLIGVQELGKGKIKFTKNQKLEVLHIAVCTLLSQYDYYRFMGNDEDGWPHFEPTETLPHLSAMQQHKMIKMAILEYFRESD